MVFRPFLEEYRIGIVMKRAIVKLLVLIAVASGNIASTWDCLELFQSIDPTAPLDSNLAKFKENASKLTRPQWDVFFGYLEKLYQQPIDRQNIAMGQVPSIGSKKPEQLSKDLKLTLEALEKPHVGPGIQSLALHAMVEMKSHFKNMSKAAVITVLEINKKILDRTITNRKLMDSVRGHAYTLKLIHAEVLLRSRAESAPYLIHSPIRTPEWEAVQLSSKIDSGMLNEAEVVNAYAQFLNILCNRSFIQDSLILNMKNIYLDLLLRAEKHGYDLLIKFPQNTLIPNLMLLASELINQSITTITSKQKRLDLYKVINSYQAYHGIVKDKIKSRKKVSSIVKTVHELRELAPFIQNQSLPNLKDAVEEFRQETKHLGDTKLQTRIYILLKKIDTLSGHSWERLIAITQLEAIVFHLNKNLPIPDSFYIDSSW